MCIGNPVRTSQDSMNVALYRIEAFDKSHIGQASSVRRLVIEATYSL
jgi:hypothetical protein